ncbi:MAG: hypothetical protein ABIW38_08880 [Ferruginibacter sp.]
MNTNFKQTIFIAWAIISSTLCIAQKTDSAYSSNNEANAFYLKALAVEKNSKPRTIGFTIDSKVGDVLGLIIKSIDNK